MRTRTIVASVWLLSACLVPTTDHPLGSLDGSTDVRCRVMHGFESEPQVCVSVQPVVCGGNACASGEVCCLTSGACVAPDAGTCPVMATTQQGGRACGSTADCGPEEWCMLDERQASAGNSYGPRCLGSGHCQSITNCGYCSPQGSARCEVCGCDGVTYPSFQAACLAGVNVAMGASGACGVSSSADAGVASVTCGTNAQCPSGSQCCALTGRCFDPTREPWRCTPLPDGTLLDCANNDECARGGAGGGTGAGNNPFLCTGSTCAGPGKCAARGSAFECSGVVQTVCGCDGQTYVNGCWAKAAGTRVASSGTCP